MGKLRVPKLFQAGLHQRAALRALFQVSHCRTRLLSIILAHQYGLRANDILRLLRFLGQVSQKLLPRQRLHQALPDFFILHQRVLGVERQPPGNILKRGNRQPQLLRLRCLLLRQSDRVYR